MQFWLMTWTGYRFMTLFQSVMANIDYSLYIKQEKYYQTIFFLV